MVIGAALAWDDDVCDDVISPGRGHLSVGSLRGGRPEVRVGAPDPSLTSVSGMAAVTELVERLGVVSALDAAVGPIKQRDRGFGAGEHAGAGVVLDHGGWVGAQVHRSTMDGGGDRGRFGD